MQPHRPPSHSRHPSSVSSSRKTSVSLANVAVPSFAAFRAQSPSVPSPVRRKPLPQPARYSSADFSQSQRTEEQRYPKRSYSLDSPTLPSLPHIKQVLSPVIDSPDEFEPRDLDEYPHGHTPSIPEHNYLPTPPTANTLAPRSRADTHSRTRPRHDRANSSYHTARDSISEEGDHSTYQTHSRSRTMSIRYNTEPTNLELQIDGVADDFLDSYQSSPPRKPKSPGEKLTSFFGWNQPTQQPVDQSSTTTFSERSLSPSSSPMYVRPNGDRAGSHTKPLALDIPKANASAQNSYFNVPGTPLLSLSPHMNAHVEELERELKHISSELAESIRREMELEDEVERWKSEIPAPSTSERRTSDYYSDSGASGRYPFGDAETKLDELEKLRRKAEQEKAQIRSEMAERVQDELRRRRDLEAQVQQLEEQVSGGARNSEDDRVRDLTLNLEDARRRLTEERQVKENFEDLLNALQKDLELHRNERDNLRDEVVPALKARVEGLEAQAAESQGASYEISRMQQELHNLRSENQALMNGRRDQSGRFRSIAEEEDDGSVSPRIGLSRSNSLARRSLTGNRHSLSRSNSAKELPRVDSKDVLNEKFKDIEEQRDALHIALKHMIIRQEAQAKEHAKTVKLLEMERDAALNVTPRRTHFYKEVTHLKEEVSLLRRRADDALDQKWQVEKGLGGLRMDLDRAQQETASLRTVLQKHEIMVPDLGMDVPPSPLDIAYKELQTTHALSIARIKEMNAGDASDSEDTLNLLMRSISDAEAERSAAQQEAERYRAQARALQQSEIAHLNKEQSLAADLYAAAQRMDELSSKVEQQLKSNERLRIRLTKAVARGEEEQKSSAQKIVELERKLKAEEDMVMSAQSQSEDVIAKHMEEVKALKDSHSMNLQRMKAGMVLSPRNTIAPSPLSPLLLKSPRLDKTTTGPGMSLNEATQADSLQKKVQDLEKALREADKEMEVVVGRMNKAQMEVADLQTEKDEAMRQTKKLQAAMQAERESMRALMDQNQ